MIQGGPQPERGWRAQMVTAARMDYVAVTFNSYYFNQVAPDLCLLGKSAVSFLGPPSRPSITRAFLALRAVGVSCPE